MLGAPCDLRLMVRPVLPTPMVLTWQRARSNDLHGRLLAAFQKEEFAWLAYFVGRDFVSQTGILVPIE